MDGLIFGGRAYIWGEGLYLGGGLIFGGRAYIWNALSPVEIPAYKRELIIRGRRGERLYSEVYGIFHGQPLTNILHMVKFLAGQSDYA